MPRAPAVPTPHIQLSRSSELPSLPTTQALLLLVPTGALPTSSRRGQRVMELPNTWAQPHVRHSCPIQSPAKMPRGPGPPPDGYLPGWQPLSSQAHQGQRLITIQPLKGLLRCQDSRGGRTSPGSEISAPKRLGKSPTAAWSTQVALAPSPRAGRASAALKCCTCWACYARFTAKWKARGGCCQCLAPLSPAHATHAT